MKKILLLILLAVFLYLPSLGVYFSGDDFFHLNISQIRSPQEFFNFFSFEKNPQSASFYRPLTTQVFFFFGQKLFGLNPWGYHMISLLAFGLTLYLVYLLSRKLLEDKKAVFLTVFFYAFSVSHFTQVYYLSAFQELGMAAFYFSALLFWLKFLDTRKHKYLLMTGVLFIFSLLSKEMAITFPLIALLFAVSHKKTKMIPALFPMFLISMVYLFLRFVFFGQVSGESYLWDFSPRIINTLGWYAAWSLGLPEMFLDYIGPKFTINPNLILYYPWQTKIIFLSFAIFISVCLFAFIQNLKVYKYYILYTAYFILSLSPVLFLPWHKFPLELTVPLFGVALFLATIFSRVHRTILLLVILSFLTANLTSYFLTLETHWVTRRGEVAKRVVNYFVKEYPKFPEGKNVYFYNNTAFIVEGWGASKHVSAAISGSDALQVLYKDQKIKVWYQDLDGEKEGNFIRLGTKDFLLY